jgi:hypothetical protein
MPQCLQLLCIKGHQHCRLDRLDLLLAEEPADAAVPFAEILQLLLGGQRRQEAVEVQVANRIRTSSSSSNNSSSSRRRSRSGDCTRALGLLPEEGRWGQEGGRVVAAPGQEEEEGKEEHGPAASPEAGGGGPDGKKVTVRAGFLCVCGVRFES